MGKSRHQSHPSSKSYDDGEFNPKRNKKHASRGSKLSSVEEVINTKTRQQSKRLLKDFMLEEDDGPYWEEF